MIGICRLGSFTIPGLSLTVWEHQYVITLGPIGAGKTVLLETIAGINPPESGQIIMDGVDITAAPPEVVPIHVYRA